MLNQKGSKTSSKLFGFVNSRHFSKNKDVQYNHSSGLNILVEISIFSPNHVFIRLTKIMNNLEKIAKFWLSKSFFNPKIDQIFPIFFCDESETRTLTN